MKYRSSSRCIVSLFSLTAFVVCGITAFLDEAASMGICSLAKNSGSPCKERTNRFYFNKETGKCEEFVYGGCKGNSNNFETYEECDALCGECTLHSEPGPCEAALHRFFYNKNTGFCELFTYGGCHGNRNNFKSLEECEKRCKGTLCFLPKDPGSCDGYIPSYYYDPKIKSCQKFIYGGCEGNANNFQTRERCEKECNVGYDNYYA